jgi:hypothetical protein
VKWPRYRPPPPIVESSPLAIVDATVNGKPVDEPLGKVLENSELGLQERDS